MESTKQLKQQIIEIFKEYKIVVGDKKAKDVISLGTYFKTVAHLKGDVLGKIEAFEKELREITFKPADVSFMLPHGGPFLPPKEAEEFVAKIATGVRDAIINKILG